MKSKRWPTLDVGHITNCLLVAAFVAFALPFTYPWMIEVATPLDVMPLPPAFLGLKLSSAFIGVFLGSVVSAIPAIARTVARAMVQDWKRVINQD